MKRYSAILCLFLLLLCIAGNACAAGIVCIEDGTWDDDENVQLYINEPSINGVYALCDGAQYQVNWGYDGDDFTGKIHASVLKNSTGDILIEEDFEMNEDGWWTWVIPDDVFAEEGEYVFAVEHAGIKVETPFTVVGRDRIAESDVILLPELTVSAMEGRRRYSDGSFSELVFVQCFPIDYSLVSYEVIKGTEILNQFTHNVTDTHISVLPLSEMEENSEYYCLVHQSGESAGIRFSLDKGKLMHSLLSKEETTLIMKLLGITQAQKTAMGTSSTTAADADETENVDYSAYGLYRVRQGQTVEGDGKLKIYQPGNNTVYALVEGGNTLVDYYSDTSMRGKADYEIQLTIKEPDTDNVVYETTIPSTSYDFWMPRGVYKPSTKYILTLQAEDVPAVSSTFYTLSLDESKEKLPELASFLTLNEPEITRQESNSVTYRVGIDISSFKKINFYTFRVISDNKNEYQSERYIDPSTSGYYFALDGNYVSSYIYVAVQGDQAAARVVAASGNGQYVFGDCFQRTLCKKDNVYFVETDPEKVKSYMTDPKVTIITTDDEDKATDSNTDSVPDEDTTADTQENAETSKTGHCTANKVNVRTEPDGSRTIGQLNKGDKVTELSRTGEWSLISCKYGEGYIKTKFIEFD